MWARRLGAPPLWPSFIKVTIQVAVVSLMIGNFIAYLAGIDVTALQLTGPAREEIICRVPPSDCLVEYGEELVECVVDKSVTIHDFRLKFVGIDTDELLAEPCPVERYDDETCSTVSYPIKSLMGDLSRLYTLSRPVNPLDAWALGFVVILLLFGCSILVHDCALLRPSKRREILSMEAAKQEVPKLWECIKRLHLRRTMATLRRTHKKLWLVVLVPYFIWQAIIFLTLAYPLALFASAIVGPAKMSRLMVFLSGALCTLWSAIFVAYTLSTKDDVYGVLWSPKNQNQCVCWCEYPLQRTVIFRVVSLAVVMAVGSLCITLRALKGLRRANWASLFSVLYAVPVNVYPVKWTDSSGNPIRWRREGEPVQEEPAFDPFALMDEQEDSHLTKLPLAPRMQLKEERKDWEHEQEENAKGIGCCGFPYRDREESGAAKKTHPVESAQNTNPVEAVVDKTETSESVVGRDPHVQ